MKYKHYYLILFSSLLFWGSVFSQTTDWFVINNSGYLVNGGGAATDRQGNLYVTGTYKGEILFKSNNEAGVVYNYLAPSSRQETFFVKYDADGNLKLSINTINYSGNAIYTVSLKVLPSGNIAWVIRVDGKYAILDKDKKEVPFQGRGQSILVLLTPQGEVLSQAALPFDYCYEVNELGNDKFLLYGRAKRSRQNEVYWFDNKTLESKQLGASLTDLYAISVNETKLFFITMKVQRSSYSVEGAVIKLYSNQLNQLDSIPHLLFTKQQKGNGLNRIWLFTENEKVDVLVNFALTKEAKVSFDDKDLNTDENKMLVLKLDEKGQVRDQLSMNTKLNGWYNTVIKKGSSGGYYIMTPVLNEFTVEGKDSATVVPRHGDFVSELVVFKFDENLNYKWNYNIGGTASNGHSSFIIPDENGISFVTDLLDFVTIEGKYHELDWRNGLMVGRIKDE